ncbi:MAG: AtuA-related protein [Streptosporangiales bacterium]
MALREVAHARSGDKGDMVNVAVIAYREEDYSILREQVTVDAATRLYGRICAGAIERYQVASIGALNFTLGKVLGGGRSRTIAFEESGKALSSVILRLEVEVPDDFVCRSEAVTAGHD